MQQKFLTIAAIISIMLCLGAATLWMRSLWMMDFKPFTTETAAGHRYWKLVSYRGGFGSKITDNWPMYWQSASIYSQPVDIPRWDFFPGGITSDKSILGFRLIRGSDRFSDGGPTDFVRTGVVVLVPYWPLVLAASILPMWLGSRIARRRHRVRSGGCAACGYDLRATPERCPECGTVAV